MAGKCGEHNLTPYVIQKLWVDEEKQENEEKEEQGKGNEVEKVEMELAGTNRLRQVWMVVLSVLWLTFFTIKVGMVAREELEQGDTIITEHPILLITPRMKEVRFHLQLGHPPTLHPDNGIQRPTSTPRVQKALSRSAKVCVDALRPRIELHQVRQGGRHQ